MTTQEAIKQLQTEHDLIANEHELDGSQFAPALLEALKAQDMTLYMNLPEVSVEEAVEILKRNNRIELLPSAQPETHGKRTETHGVCLDVISRRAAIDGKISIQRTNGVDEESGIKHLKHLACNIAFLCEMEEEE